MPNHYEDVRLRVQDMARTIDSDDLILAGLLNLGDRLLAAFVDIGDGLEDINTSLNKILEKMPSP